MQPGGKPVGKPGERPGEKIRVVIADDHEMVRAGFRMLVESLGKIDVVGEAADGSQAFALAVREKPDVLLIDASMPPGRSGLAILDDVHTSCPKVRVIILTMFSEPEYLRYALEHHASGYMLKSASPEELCEAIETVAAGGTYISQQLRDVYEKLSQQDREPSPFDKLSMREQEALRLLAKGYTNKQVAASMSVSEKTVEAYRAHVYAKMGFKDRAELVEFALKHRIIGASGDVGIAQGKQPYDGANGRKAV